MAGPPLGYLLHGGQGQGERSGRPRGEVQRGPPPSVLNTVCMQLEPIQAPDLASDLCLKDQIGAIHPLYHHDFAVRCAAHHLPRTHRIKESLTLQE